MNQIQKATSALEEFTEKIDTALADAEKGNLFPIQEVLNFLDTVEDFAGVTKAKILYRLSKILDWEIFMDIATQHLHKANVPRYLRVAAQLPNMPPEIETKANIGKLIPVAKALEDGLEFVDEDWDIVIGGTISDVNALIREKKGVQPKEGTKIYKLHRDGTITCNGVEIGRLYVDRDDLLELIQIFVNRSHLITE